MKGLNTARLASLGWAARQTVVLLLGAALAGPAAQSQQRSEQGAPQRSGMEAPARVPARPPDIISDNLDRAAASADQILEVLNKEAGLMVELKRLLAQDAGASGQILEESDLTEGSVADRLRSDVRARVLATRLLQRYGYLVPRLNPDSELGAEQRLVRQERAQMLARAAERRDTLGESSATGRNATCDPRSVPECALPSSFPEDRESLPVGPTAPARAPRSSAPLQRAEDLSPNQTTRPDGTSLSEDQRSGYPASLGGPETVFTSARVEMNPPLNSTARMPAYGSADNLSVPLATQPDLQSLSMPQSNQLSTDNGMPRSDRGFERSPGGRNSATAGAAAVEPVKMVRRPNPYADVPSLYDLYVQAGTTNRPLERFGLDVFRKGAANPDYIPMDLPVGPSYVVGPGDSLSIDLWGGVSQRLPRTVDREGRVALPEVGPVLVAGRTLGDVQETVQRTLRTQFRNVSADVSLLRLRSVRVYVVGDVTSPGAYDISSLSTPLNALFVAGGVTPQGSLRRLQHYRGKQLIEEVDAYDLLLHGIRGDLQRLENGDSLMVPPLGPIVTVEGMVRRPAVYELRDEKTLLDVVDLSGGILPAAALRHIEVQRLVAHEKRTMLTLDLSPNVDADSVKKQLDSFKINDGDEIHIFPIAPYNGDAIYVQGHVLRPGRYSYKEGIKLSDLIGSYKDLLPEPAPHYAEIVRLNAPDFHPSVESFDLSAALANPASGPKLQPLDTVRVFSRFDFEPAPEIWIGGEVRAPGKYRTSGQVHLKDAVYLAGGITQDASLDSAQLFRTQPDGTMKILSVDLREALAGNPVDNILVQPRDRLLVHRNPSQVEPPTVYIKGEVAKPGRYPLTTNMRVEELVRVAGGLKRSAYAESADLARFDTNGSRKNPGDRLELNLAAAMSGDPKTDVPLRDGDILTIRQLPRWTDIGASITVRGEILHPGTYGIVPGERLSSVLQRSGGFGSEAYPYGAVLVRREVRDLEIRSHLELVQRVKAEQGYLKSLPEADTDQKNAKMTAVAQTQSTLDQLEATAPIGRVVIHIRPDVRSWRNTAADIPLREGDVLVVPKTTNYVTVTGQVFNPTAVAYVPGRSAKWYLSQAGGLTQLANKKAVFVVRGDGSVLGAKNNTASWWSGDPLHETLRPGDSIVVPEMAPKIGGRNWATIMQAAQIASSAALTVAYIKP